MAAAPLPAARARRALAALLLSLAAACDGGPAVAPVDDPSLGGPSLGELERAELSGDRTTDQATLARLEARARTLARTDGCASGECAAQAIGAKACGGPRYHLPYCRRTTDVAALQATAAEIERFERLFNERYGVGSTCDWVEPPTLAVVAGSCVARR